MGFNVKLVPAEFYQWDLMGFCCACAPKFGTGSSTQKLNTGFSVNSCCFLALLQARHHSSSLVQKEEVGALLQFKAHLSPPSQAMLRGWHANNTLSICDGISWVGVTCNHHHRIRAINLTNFGLVGPLAPDLGNLSTLSSLNLGSNFLTGVIPPQLSGCSSLQALNLAINNLTGPIPSSLSSLSSLQNLNLGGNNLNGQIPQSLFANFTSLIKLGLCKNTFTGSIPDLPTTLEDLLLWGNNFTGSIPHSLGNCTNLVLIQISQTQLTNQIPTEIGFLTNLAFLYLQENNLEGAIPHTIGNLTSLIELETSFNQLAGPIPPSLVCWVQALFEFHCISTSS